MESLSFHCKIGGEVGVRDCAVHNFIFFCVDFICSAYALWAFILPRSIYVKLMQLFRLQTIKVVLRWGGEIVKRVV